MATATQAQMIQETLARVKHIESLLEAALAPEEEGITLEADSRGGIFAKLKKTIRL